MSNNYQPSFIVTDESIISITDSKKNSSVIKCIITSSLKVNIYEFADKIESSGLVKCIEANSETGLVLFLKLDPYLKQSFTTQCLAFILSLNPVSSYRYFKSEEEMIADRNDERRATYTAWSIILLILICMTIKYLQ